MASSPTVSAQPGRPASEPVPAAAAGAAGEQALIRTPAGSRAEAEPPAWSSAVVQLPVELDVTVPVRGFRVRNLLALEPGQVIESRWGYSEDVPLGSVDVQLAWSEFEVVDTRLAVRITRLY
jgi:flagellar motor switch protein FliN